MKTSIKTFRNSTFITSLFVLILIVVAVSTSTFAWFSASNIVNVTTISFTASSQNQGEDGIMYINWDKDDKTPNYSITFAQPDYLNPMMPIYPLEIGNTDFDTMINNFNSSTESDGIYNTDGYIDVQPYILQSEIINEDETPKQDFYLHNTNENLPLNVTITYEIEGALAEKLCVAIFVDKQLQYMLCNSEVYYGEIHEGTKVEDTLSQDLSSTINNSFIIDANGYRCINMIAWLNGVTTTNSDIEKKVTLTNLQFKGNYTTN